MNPSSSLIPLCPKCNSYSFVTVPNRSHCNIYCCCGYYSKYSITDYLSLLPNLKSSQQLLCEQHKFSYFCNDCKSHLCFQCKSNHSKNHLLLLLSFSDSLFSSLKDD